MNRWDRISTELRDADPGVVEQGSQDRVWQAVRNASSDSLKEHGQGSWRPSAWGRRGVVAAIVGVGAAIVVTIALLPGPSDPAVPGDPLAAAAIVAADQDPVALADEEFLYRRSETWRIAAPDLVPGLPFSRDGAVSVPSVQEREVWLNYTGGGETADKLIEPEAGHGRDCSSGDVLLGMVITGFGICPLEFSIPSRGGGLLFDEALGMPREIVPDDGGLAAVGDAVDELPTDPERLADVLNEAAKQKGIEPGGGFSPGESSEAARKLDLVTGVLANPIGSPRLRAAAFEYASTIEGIETDDATSDPDGREGASVSLVEPSRAESFDFGTATKNGSVVEEEINLTGVEVRRELIFDPETSDVLSTRTSLIAAPNGPLADWLDSEGSPLVVEYTTFEPTEVVTREDLVLERVQCADGSFLLRKAEREGPCAGQLHPSLEDDARRLFDALRAAGTPEDEARLEAELAALMERSDELNFANPKEPTPGDTDTVIEP